jgi:ribulose-5-phosphate 4-epimerase/fuculose-1-phosphate aldolase
MVNLTAVLSTLITANHILHYHKVLDAYGHVSVRNPIVNSTFFLAANIAPALVSSPADLVEYYVSNASSVDPNAPPGYIERYIHSEILKRFPDINCVIHSHSEIVLPFTVVNILVQPAIHMAGFLGSFILSGNRFS